MKYSLTLTGDLYNQLKSHLIRPDGLERAAILICGRVQIIKDIWDGGPEERFLSRKMIPIPDCDILSQSAVHVQWDTKILRHAIKEVETEDHAICLVHNHPSGAYVYSSVDDENEPECIKTIYNRNGGDRPHLSIVLTADGEIFGRAWSKNLKSYPLELIRVLGEKFHFFYPGKHSTISREIFHRQQLAFGKALNNDLEQLKIAVIGAGATGTATATLLSKIGVGQILLIDNDIVERSNLSRLHGAKAADADAGRFKVEVLKDYLASAGLGTRIRTISDWVGSKQCREAIKSCDIAFGCTDDHSGRIFLNRFSHFYLIPVFDMGIVIEPDEHDPSKLVALQGRLTVLFPGNVCILCRRAVDITTAREEQLKRTDPMGFERLKDEAYVEGAGNPSPAVITFTTEVATMSVNELINRITGFKKNGAMNNIMRFFDRGEDTKPGANKRDGCPICNENGYWGAGDVVPFLDQTN